MNPVTSLVLSAALLVGGAGGVAAFQHAARPDLPTSASASAAETADPAPAAATATPQPARRAQHRPRVRWAPCPDGSSLEDGVCVTDVVRTVTVPAPAAPAVSHAGASATTQHLSGDDDGDDEGDDHGDDHGDDDRGDDHGDEGDD